VRVGQWFGRVLRQLRVLREQALRGPVLAVLGLFAALSVVSLLLARGAMQYGQNLALNVAAEFIGAATVIFALAPIARRAQQGGVREHRRLDFSWYTDRVVTATGTVRVLHTFSRLFAPPFDQRFFAAATGLARRRGSVQVLLMHPDSMAAQQRTAELRGHGDVAQLARQNLRALAAFRRDLPDQLRRRVEVRLYTASASVQVYQWDNRLLASFLPLGRRSGDHAQLEVSVDSPLGDFLLERFDELWEHAVPLEDYMTVRLSVTAGGTQREYAARYVTVDGAYYLDDAAILAQLARERNRTVHAALTLEPARTYRVEILPDESAGLPDARSRFTEKYDHPAPVLVRLTPQP
jgi:hypothetical protein